MKSVLRESPAARAAWAKKLVQDTDDGRDPRDVLSGWERENFFAWDSVQLRLPLRDPVEARRYIDLILGTFQELSFKLERTPEGDRMDLLTIHSVVKALNQKLNDYPSRKRRSRFASGT